MAPDDLMHDEWAGERGRKWLANIAGMEAMLESIDAPLIQELRLDSPVRIADIGCGGGRTSVGLLSCAPQGSSVYGFDVSPALIEAARFRFPPDMSSPSFIVMDVSKEKAPEQKFDRLVSRFGVMFFDDPDEAFARLFEWLVPGGRFAFAVWGKKEENPWMLAVKRVIEQFVEVPRIDPDGPGPFRYSNHEKFSALLGKAGFRNVQKTDWRGQLPIGGAVTPIEAARFAIASFSSFVDLLAQAGPAILETAHRELAEYFRPYYRDGAVHFDACIHLVSGVRC